MVLNVGKVWKSTVKKGEAMGDNDETDNKCV